MIACEGVTESRGRAPLISLQELALQTASWTIYVSVNLHEMERQSTFPAITQLPHLLVSSESLLFKELCLETLYMNE